MPDHHLAPDGCVNRHRLRDSAAGTRSARAAPAGRWCGRAAFSEVSQGGRMRTQGAGGVEPPAVFSIKAACRGPRIGRRARPVRTASPSREPPGSTASAASCLERDGQVVTPLELPRRPAAIKGSLHARLRAGLRWHRRRARRVMLHPPARYGNSAGDVLGPIALRIMPRATDDRGDLCIAPSGFGQPASDGEVVRGLAMAHAPATHALRRLGRRLCGRGVSWTSIPGSWTVRYGWAPASFANGALAFASSRPGVRFVVPGSRPNG